MTTPRHDLLFALPGLVATQISTVLPALGTCKGFAGRFDVAVLKRLGIAAPAVLVSRLGCRQAEVMAGPHKLFEADMAAFIVTKDALGLPRDEAAQNISAVLLRLIPEKTWGQVGVGAAQKVREVGMITEASEKEAISLWAVTWMQPLALDGYLITAPQPIDLYVGQAPNIGAANTGSYEQVGT
ncbi:MAG: hypothetical protein U1E48_04585 [Paracoccaceae bacterium]